MRNLSLCLVCAVVAAAGQAQAQTASPDHALKDPAVAAAAPRPISDTDLSGFSGGEAIAAVTDQQLTALNSGNTINAGSVVNGAVNLSANAFSGYSGIGNFVINTGNNNNLQGVMSVNIVMVPAATP